jgi:hypothetical protein
MSNEIRISRGDALRALRHLEMIVLSLDRIGSASVDMTKEEYDTASSEFLDDWGVTEKLAEVREILSDQFSRDAGEDGMDDLERELEDTPHWRFASRKPPVEQ